MTSKSEILQQLLLFSAPSEELKTSLTLVDWDSDDGVELKKEHVISVMQRFIRNDISLSDVLFWSNAIECREDIDCNHTESERILEIIHEMANPDLYGVLDEQVASKLVHELKSMM